MRPVFAEASTRHPLARVGVAGNGWHSQNPELRIQKPEWKSATDVRNPSSLRATPGAFGSLPKATGMRRLADSRNGKKQSFFPKNGFLCLPLPTLAYLSLHRLPQSRIYGQVDEWIHPTRVRSTRGRVELHRRAPRKAGQNVMSKNTTLATGAAREYSRHTALGGHTSGAFYQIRRQRHRSSLPQSNAFVTNDLSFKK